MAWLYRFATIAIVVGLQGMASQVAMAQTNDESIGVIALVNPDATLSRSTEERLPQAGEDVFLDDRMLTDAEGQVHLMLVDKSSFTVGPNSDITIDRFVYDPETRAGDMALSAARGVMRFVGGDLSKNNPVEIQTSIGTLGIRGGIMLLEISDDGGLTAVFGFGTSLSFTSSTGVNSAPVVRPGFMIQVSPGGDVSAPIPAPPDVVNSILAALESIVPATVPSGNETPGFQPTNSQQADGGGNPTPPTLVVPDNLSVEVQEITLTLLGEDVTDIVEIDDGTFIVEFEDSVTETIIEQQFNDDVESASDTAVDEPEMEMEPEMEEYSPED